jgi:hypothetical protein
MTAAEDDLYSSAQDYAPRLCELGTVGWSSREDITDLGTVDNDGQTFVRVTLYAGKTPGDAVKKGVAQGREILCCLNALGGFSVPPRGSRVYVLFPSGMEQVDGVGLIVGVVRAGQETRSNEGEGNKTITATEGVARVVVKKSGSIVLFTTNDNTPTGKAVVLELSPTKIAFSAPWGSFVLDASGYHLKTAAGPRLDMGGVQIPGIPSDLSDPLTSYCSITAPTINVKGAIVKLGVGPAYGTALQAPSSALAVPVPVSTGPTSQSTSVWVTTP